MSELSLTLKKDTIMVVTYYCREAKAGKKGEAPIQAAISINGKRKFINLPLKYNPTKFKKETESKKDNELKNYLSACTTNINRAVMDMAQYGIPLTHHNLRDYFKNGGIKSYTVDDLINEYMASLEQRVKNKTITKTTYGKYQIVKKLFLDDVDKDSELPSVTPRIIRSFQNRLLEIYKIGTVDGMLTKLKSIFTYAFENGYIKSNPFAMIKIEKAKPKIEYLDDEEVEKLRTVDLQGNKSLERVRDMALLQLSTGLSYADLKAFNPKEDLKESDGVYFITKPRMKTGVTFCTPVLKEGMEVLEKYGFTVPLPSNQKQNCYLKVLGDLAGITKRLHTHLFRKTFATRMLASGVSLTSVSKMCGHSEVRTTQLYYAKTLDETVIQEVRKLEKKTAYNL